MANRYTQSVEIHSRNNRDLPPSKGQIKIVEWSKQERLKNAIKTLGMYFAFTCFSVMIPVLHYVLVPTLFVVMFIMAMDKYTQQKYNEGGEGVCPGCSEKIILEKSKFKERLTDTCGKCHDDVEILIGAVVKN